MHSRCSAPCNRHHRVVTGIVVAREGACATNTNPSIPYEFGFGIAVKNHSRIAPAVSTGDLFPDGPLSLINRPISRVLRQDMAQAAARQNKREQGEGRKKGVAVHQCTNSNVFHDISFPGYRLTSSQAAEAKIR
jgi:hypothetical protein